MGDHNKLNGVYELHLPEGKTFHLSRRITNEIKARYEDWLEGAARRRVINAFKSGELSAEEFKLSMEATSSASAAGKFSWNGEAWQESLQQLPGMVKLFSLLAQASGKEQKADDGAILELLQRQYFVGEGEGGWLVHGEDGQKVLGPFGSEVQARTEAEAALPGTLFLLALKEIQSTSPNFRSPPVRGA